jgi:ribosome-binding factor A
MSQGSRPERVGEELRHELSQILAREVHDPGVGFVTLTRVKVSPDLQVARVFYTQMGDDRAKKDTTRALERATPFLRRQIASRLRLRRVPELHFTFDQTVEHQDRIERILLELQQAREAQHAAAAPGTEPEAPGTEQAAPTTEPEAPGTGPAKPRGEDRS